jgi:hypothetical protein
MSPSEWTWARALRNAGYQTALIGKMHMNPMRSEIGFAQSLYSEHAMRRRVAPGEPMRDDYESWLAGFGLGAGVIPPGTYPRAAGPEGPLNAATMGTYPSGDAPLRNPITGIAGCCARAASGHAAAPPSSVMNSRRLTRSPRRRVAEFAKARRDQAPWRS